MTALTDFARRASAAAALMRHQAGVVMRPLVHALVGPPGDVTLAGVSATYAVRAGADPAYRSEQQLHRLTARILRGWAPGTLFLTDHQRALVAAEALRSWVVAYPAPAPQVLAWHRRLAGTAVIVTREVAA